MTSTTKQAGDYDRNFGQEGKFELPCFFGSLLGRNFTAMVPQNHNTLVSALVYDDAGKRHYAIIRLTPEGSLDTAFGREGMFIGRFNEGEHSQPEALAVLADGRIAMLGLTAVPARPFPKPMLLLLDQDGNSPTVPVMLEVPEAAALVIGSGRLTASGTHFMAALNLYSPPGMPQPKPRVYRLDLQGNPGFANRTFIEVKVAADEDQVEIAALVQLEDGFIVSGSRVSASNASEGFIARYDNTGLLDAAFGKGGIIAFQVPGQATRINTLSRRSNGSLVVAGYSQTDETSPSHAFHWQFTALGAVDPAFNQGNPVVDDKATAWYSASLDSDGRLITFGIGDIYLYRRYLPNGSIDPDYNPAAELVGNQEGMTCLNHGRITLLGYNAPAAIGVIGTVTAIQN